MPQKTTQPRAELHAHLGASVDPPILWSIAHKQGIKLPTKDYWEFEDLITIGDTEKEKNKDLNDMHFNRYHWTELIQSSPEAVEEAVKSVFGGGYRACNITVHELRLNPMFRNRQGERDLDYIIKAALWGMERAIMEYPQVKAGIILSMGRLLSVDQNAIILRKAIKYKNSGIVGLEIGDPAPPGFDMRDYIPLFAKAREAGLGITIHTGEQESLDEMWMVVEEIKPERIGHGVMAANDPKLLARLAELGTVLELCPSSNLKNSTIKNIDEMRRIYRAIANAGVKFTINTDGPEMYRTNIYKEQRLLIDNNIFTEEEVERAMQTSFEATFIK